MVQGPGHDRGVAAAAQEDAPQAYVHFRWEEEEGVPVLYCYEIQLEAAVQRKGLGKCVRLHSCASPACPSGFCMHGCAW